MCDFLLAIQAPVEPVAKKGTGFVARRVALPAMLLAAGLSTSGCLFQKKVQARTFRPPVQKRVDPAPLKFLPSMDPPALDAKGDGSGLDLIASLRPVIELPPPPAAPPPVQRRPQTTSPKPVPPPPPVPETPAQAKIVRLYTPQQEGELNRSWSDFFGRAQSAVDKMAGKNLTAEQKDKLEEIQGFLLQAKQAKEQDLETAVNLAKHADILATALVNRLP